MLRHFLFMGAVLLSFFVQRVEAAQLPDTDPAVLLITDQSLADAWQAFAEHKTTLGLPTKIVTVQAITAAYEGADTQARIRACVLDHIDRHKTSYIILGGDSGPNGSGLVPDRDTPHVVYGNLAYQDIPTDLYYISPEGFGWDANGDGVYGEWKKDLPAMRYTHPSGAAIARIPMRTAADVKAYTDKVIAYEMRYPKGQFAQRIMYTNTVNGSEPKVRRSWDDYLSNVWEGGEAYRFFHTQTSWDKDEPGDYALRTDNWVNRINANEVGKMHMHGHGFVDQWVLEDNGGHTSCNASIVERLTNQDAYLVMTTVSCFTGMYDSTFDPSITETMLRTPNKGAVVILCPSREGVPIFHNPQVDFRLMMTEGKLDGTTETMTRFWINGLSPREDGTYRTIGESFVETKHHMAQHAMKTEGYHWCQSGLNLLGDPTLSFRAMEPVDPKAEPHGVSIKGEGKEGELHIKIKTALRGNQNARLCVWQRGGGYAVVPIDSDGNAEATIAINREAGDVTYAVAGPTLNAVSKKLDIPVVAIP